MEDSEIKSTVEKESENLETGWGARGRTKRLVVYMLAVITILTVGGSAFYFRHELLSIKKNPQKIVQEETQKLLAEVSKLIVLPEGETPTVATVTDPERLKDQAFFVKAKKGDKVLIYTEAKKAILYDPLQRRIVEVAPIKSESQKAAP